MRTVCWFNWPGGRISALCKGMFSVHPMLRQDDGEAAQGHAEQWSSSKPPADTPSYASCRCSGLARPCCFTAYGRLQTSVTMPPGAFQAHEGRLKGLHHEGHEAAVLAPLPLGSSSSSRQKYSIWWGLVTMKAANKHIFTI